MTTASETHLDKDSASGGGSKIHLDRVGKTYPGSKVPAVEELTLDVPEGEILVLVGPSGCGKSTTLRLINRMIEPSTGRILLDGEDVTRANPDKLRRRIGYVIQQIGLFPHQTIAQNIATVPKMLGWDKTRIQERTTELLTTVGLDPEQFAHRYPRELSGGQAQRVGVARALGADPDIMLMDEPFGAIDPITRDRLQNEFLRLQAELHKTIVFVTHDIDEAIKMGDRIAILGERSMIRQVDTPERILAYPVDDFVSDFIGTGATIKGLNFLKVSSLTLADFPTMADGDSPEAVRGKLQQAGYQWAVVLDAERRPSGWIHQDALGGSGEQAPIEGTLDSDGTLFHALEQMVQSESGMTVVTGASGRFEGVVRMTDLAKAIRRAQVEARRHYDDLEANS
ncbi:ABC transporter ATP-binding protein [Nocardioides acrostichi]|uniref:ABC-type quaternary amine transporter n=1 Tax=Nocardioides acrostichi TaxID=2784339 RepID=A0A930V0D1_9ACTN|nr:betaine/proline/choline family ABC transporter ATP-binding protein [Nocardioides acrostichi]MBF4161551.1 betaine/proline/choline family ABC transporter ATP-binding protein [Nocardioides acrostichi]